MSLSRDSQYRIEAENCNTKGKEYCAEEEWDAGIEEFKKAVATLNQIDKENMTDDDYRLLKKYRQNVAISYGNKAAEDFKMKDISAAIEWYKSAVEAIAQIKNLTDKDDENLANNARIIYSLSDPPIKPVSDEFEEYTKTLIADLEAEKKDKPYTDHDYRNLSRWNFYLAQSIFEEFPETRLENAIAMQNKVIKRYDWDERELSACYLKQADDCKKNGMMKDAAQACQQSANCLKKIKATIAGDGSLQNSINDLLREIGDNPQNNKKDSASNQNCFFKKLTAESADGEKESFYFPVPRPGGN